MKLIDKIYAWCFETIKKEEKEQPVFIPASEIFLKNYKVKKENQQKDTSHCDVSFCFSSIQNYF